MVASSATVEAPGAADYEMRRRDAGRQVGEERCHLGAHQASRHRPRGHGGRPPRGPAAPPQARARRSGASSATAAGTISDMTRRALTATKHHKLQGSVGRRGLEGVLRRLDHCGTNRVASVCRLGGQRRRGIEHTGKAGRDGGDTRGQVPCWPGPSPRSAQRMMVGMRRHDAASIGGSVG